MKTIPRGIHSSRQHEPWPEAVVECEQRIFTSPPPERQTLLEEEIEAILNGPKTERTARRILKIDRIALALKILDEHEARPNFMKRKPESSDAR